MMWLIAQLPGVIRWKIGRLLGALFLKRNSKRAAIVELNLSWAFPELSADKRASLAQRSFSFTGQMLIDYGFCWWSSARRFEDVVEIEGLEPIQALLAKVNR